MPQPVEGLKGKDVSLNCELKGTAPFDITWFKDKKALKEGRKYKFVYEGCSTTMHILGLEASDASEYECKASNSVGSDTCSVSVMLRGLYTFCVWGAVKSCDFAMRYMFH